MESDCDKSKQSHIVKQYVAIKNKMKSYLNFDKLNDYNDNKKRFGEKINENLMQSYFTFKFCSKKVIPKFNSFFINNGYTNIIFHKIINNSTNESIDDGKRLLLSIDIDPKGLETMMKSITNTEEIVSTKSAINNIEETDDNNNLNKETEKIVSMQILFTKYVVSETIQSILELLKHFEVVSETSVIRNNNGNFGVDFLKSLPGAKQQLKHTDFKNNGINSTGSSIIINFENFPLGLYLWINEKKHL